MSPTVAAAQPSTFEREFRAALAQRSDAGSPAAAYHAAARAAHALLAERWAATQAAEAKRGAARRVHYLSMEYLMGRALGNAVAALNLREPFAALLRSSPAVAAAVAEQEKDAALGNGGLGRLAACFLDAFATLGLPSFAYGLRYEQGIFAQRIADGAQVESPDDWLRDGNPWEHVRQELAYPVGFGGVVVSDGNARRWAPAETVVAKAHDFVVPGHHTEHVSTLRLWRAMAARPIDYAMFSRGEHLAAGEHLQRAAALNWVLYPDDSTPAGRELRLRQEHLLVSASVQDMLARHLREGGALADFGRRNAVHLNDTHPALAPAELMRLLIDEHGVPWDEAWAITREAVSYTNHTLMPEALETWSLPLVERLLPRHLEIVYGINERFLAEVRERFPGDEARVARLSLIDEQGERRVRMAALAVVASNRVNGVSALHSRLMVQTLFADQAAIWPERFVNITNGITPRRWLEQANPRLAAVLDQAIGSAWRRDLIELRRLLPLARDAGLARALQRAKHANKERLAERIRRELGLRVDPAGLFDVQVKRFHEYKRQLLNVLQVVARWQAIAADPTACWQPRTVVFAGKAASAYAVAKQIIRLIHDVARVVNSDARMGDRLKIVFLPDYGVSLAEEIIPAADLSEQISTAGTEASGTGNMKFALNGALTIGTWDGANIEMAEAFGRQNMFEFGLHAEGVARIKSLGYDPKLYVEQSLVLQRVLEAVGGGAFSPGETDRYRGLVQGLTQRDPYLLMADFAPYVQAQAAADALYADPEGWCEKVVLNIAGMGSFSVDRTIAEYQRQVWSRTPG